MSFGRRPSKQILPSGQPTKQPFRCKVERVPKPHNDFPRSSVKSNDVMGTLVAFPKLAELRARTDRDLVRILNADLERSLALANVAATRRSVFRSQAEAMYNRAKILLPRLSGVTAGERTELETKLKELGMALDLVPGTMDLEEQSACF